MSKSSIKAEGYSFHHTYWVLTSIKELTIDENIIPIPYIVFDSANRYHGNFGCNKFFGEYFAGKKRLSLSYAGATKLLCTDMNTEKAFYVAIRERITNYKIDNKTLILLNKKTEILRFTARDSIIGPS